MVLLIDLTVSGTLEINFIDLVNAVLSTILLQSIELLLILITLEVTFLTPLQIIVIIFYVKIIDIWVPFFLLIVESDINVLFISSFNRF